MKAFAQLITLVLGLSSLSSARLSDSARTDRAHRHRELAEHLRNDGGVAERATLPEARFGMNKQKPRRGVNLGNWLVTEAWMSPGFYYNAPGGRDNLIPDEKSWILAHPNRQDAYAKLDKHYTAYLKESDFQQMAELGINAVRMPIPYWTMEDGPSSSDEVFNFKGGRAAIRQALLWCKKYKIHVLLDLHAAPGSQNGWDHSGQKGPLLWPTQRSYYDRTVKVVQRMADWYVNNASYGGIVKAIQPLNEPLVGTNAIPMSLLQQFYIDTYRVVRKQVSAARGAKYIPTMVFSDALMNPDPWLQWYQDRYNDGTFIKGTVSVATNRYQLWAFSNLNNDDRITRTCGQVSWLQNIENTVPVVVGEMNGALATRCVDYRTCEGYTMEKDIAGLNQKSNNYYTRRLWEAQQTVYDAYTSGWFYWSWKTVSASQWSYRDSVAQRWLPKNLTSRVFIPSGAEISQGQCVSSKPNRPIKFATQS